METKELVANLNDNIQDKIDRLKELSINISKYNNCYDCTSCFSTTSEEIKYLYKDLNEFIELIKHYKPIIDEIESLMKGARSQEIASFMSDIEALWGRKVNINISNNNDHVIL